MSENHSCFACGAEGSDMFGYIICDACKEKLGLFTDATIARHISTFAKLGKKPSYAKEISSRLDFVEKDYIKKKIKLQYILERIKELS